ncbi:hypothetical protein KFL_000160520 [Klebsormidium nitens]|uniref:Uncharacterized protein n=1 Tax=Klebsormidium nitens TaxID=105231 RepID=A0A1Y1HJE6_KLENI|nr:hypothetical protein KFL_000160520 [Klebsormidium nitens]|eukprot:GAQ78650.1 hypothetical protein KFL_000160520 [Klebsormidium nitens]
MESTDEQARASFDDLALFGFFPLVSFLERMSVLTVVLPSLLKQLAPARAVAQEMVADVRGPSETRKYAEKFLESTSKLQALCEAPPKSPFDARPEEDVHAALLAEWHEMTGDDVTQGLIDTRHPADVIGTDGEFLGTRGRGTRLEETLDWTFTVLCMQAHVVATGLLEEVFNVTWAVKQFAVVEAGYLEYGFALFDLLKETTSWMSVGGNVCLWFAAIGYLTEMLRILPSKEHVPPPFLKSDEQVEVVELAAIEKGVLEWAVAQSQVKRHYDATQLKELIVAVFERVSKHEVGRERFESNEPAVKALVQAADDALFKPTPAVLSKPEDFRLRDHLDCISLQIKACWNLLMSDAPDDKANERWRAFLATGGIPLLKKVLGKREVLLQLAEEQLPLPIGFWPVPKMAEALWERAASEAGLTECANPFKKL